MPTDVEVNKVSEPNRSRDHPTVEAPIEERALNGDNPMAPLSRAQTDALLSFR
jgi:hypothetical protein